MKLQSIAVDRLTFGHKIRPETAGDIAGLKRSLEETGQLVPIMVRPKGRKFEVVYGHRRALAVKRSRKLKKIMALVVPATMTDSEVLQRAMIENVVREDMTPIELGKAIVEYKKMSGATSREVGALLGKKEDRIKDYIQVTQEPASIQQLVTKGVARPLCESHVRATRRQGITTSERVALLTSAARHGISQKELERRAKDIAETKSQHIKKQIIDAPKGDTWYTRRNLERQYASFERDIRDSNQRTSKDRALGPIMRDLKELLVVAKKIRAGAGRTLYSPESLPFLVRKLDEAIRALEAVKAHVLRQRDKRNASA